MVKMTGLYFKSAVWTEGSYQHFKIEIMSQNPQVTETRVIGFDWQGDNTGGVKDWYAFGFVVNNDTRGPESLETAAAFTRKLEKGYQKGHEGHLLYGWNTRPSHIIGALVAMGLPEYCQDPRLSKDIPLAEVLPDGYQLYLIRGTGAHSQRGVNVLARDDREAQRLGLTEFAKQISDEDSWCREGDAAALAGWIQDGQPVARHSVWGVVDPRPAMEKADSMHPDIIAEPEESAA